MKEINKRLANLEDKQYNVTSKFSFDSKIEERLKKLEEKSEFVNSKLIDEKQLQIKIENFERMRKNSKDKNNANFQEDILNEINNLYSVFFIKSYFKRIILFF